MKKQRSLLRHGLAFLMALWAFAVNGQGSSCSTAILQSEDYCNQVTHVYSSGATSTWIVITPSTDDTLALTLKTPASPADTPVAEPKKVIVYSGDCNNLATVATYNIAHGTALPIIVPITGLSADVDYYVEIQRYYNSASLCEDCRAPNAYLDACFTIAPSNLYGMGAWSAVDSVFTSWACGGNCPPTLYICQGDTVRFKANHAPNVFQPTLNWDFTGGVPGSALNQSFHVSQYVTYPNLGTYYAMYFDAGTGANLPPDSIIIQVMPAPIAGFNVSGELCQYEQVCFTDNSNGGNVGSVTSWYENNQLVASNTFNYCNYFAPGQHTICYTVKRGTCIDSICQVITIDTPSVSFTAGAACFGQPIVFTGYENCFDSTTADFFWNFGDGYTINGLNGTQIPTGTNNGTTSGTYNNPQHNYASPGTYNVTLGVQDGVGNWSQYIGQITVFPTPAPISITTTATAACGPANVCFSPYSSDDIYQVWDASFSQQYSYSIPVQPGCIYVDFTPMQATGAAIVVTHTDANGCSRNDTLMIPACCMQPNIPMVFNDSTSNRFGAGPTNINGGTYYINGTLVVNTVVNITNATLQMGPNAKIIVRQNSNLNTFAHLNLDKCNVWAGCGQMWDGIYIEGSTNAMLDLSQCKMEDAIKGVVSVNAGNYNIRQTVLNRNLVGVTIQPFTGTHPGRIASSTFECVNSLNAAYPNNSTLLPPHQGAKSDYGVYSAGTGTQQCTLTVGDPVAASYKNTFTAGLKYGIYTKNVNLNVYNNEFSYINLLPTSKAVWVVGRNPALWPTINFNTYFTNIGGAGANEGNKFINCKFGAYVDVCMKGQISYNKFEYVPIVFNTVMSGTAITYNNTTGGIGQTMTIQRDTIINATTGITGSNNTNSTTTIKECYITTNVSTLNNTTGIRMNGNLGPNGIYTVYNNDITNVRFGVFAQGLKNVSINGNRITVKPFGITRGINIHNNVQPRVVSNTVNASPVAQTNQNVGGIFITASSSSLVECNTVRDIHHSIKFEGTASNGAAVYRNRLHDGTHGFWLHGGPVLGNQGSSTYPSDNTWNGSFTWDTYMSTLGSNFTVGNNSRIYHRSSPSQYVPTPNGSTPFPSVAMSPHSLSGSFAYQACFYPMPVGWGHKAKLLVVNDEVNTETKEGQWLSVHSVYRDLVAGWDTLLTGDSTLIKNDSLFIAFKDSMDATVTGRLEAMIDAINSPDAMDYAALTSEWSSLAPNNTIETYFHTVTGIALTARSTGEPLSEADLVTLRDIAMLCPYTDGVAVFLARSMVAPYDSAGTEYVSLCEETPDTTGGNKLAIATGEPVSNGFSVHPNPALNTVTVEYVLTEGEQGVIEVYNISGSKVLTHPLPSGEASLPIDLERLNAGIYFYRINVNSTPVVTDKLVIIK